MTTSATTPGSKVGRARRRFSQLWQAPLFVFGLLALIGAAASAPWRHPPKWWEFHSALTSLRHDIDRNSTPDALVAQAEEIRERVPQFADRAAEAEFLIGSAYYRQARVKPPAYARETWVRAVEHLSKANDTDLNEADRLARKYRLGFCCYQIRKDVPRALELMLASVEKGAEQPLDGYRLLVKANLELKPPNLESAKIASQRVLDLTPERDVEAASHARLQHGDLLLRLKKFNEAFKELERIDAKAPRNSRVKARLMQARACEEEGLWQKAAGIWQGTMSDANLVEGGKARIYYALGWCHHHMEPPNNNETVRVWSEALKLGGPEGQAAGLHLGELRLSMGEKDVALALADWKQALANVRSPGDFKNPHFDIADVCKLFERALTHFDEAQDPEKAQQVAELYRKLAPGGEADKRRAKAAEELAEQWLDKHKAKSGNITLDHVHGQFRRAAEAHELAARALPPEQRPESLWRAAVCFLSAKDPLQAARIMTEHVTLEKNEPRLAESWFTLGDLYRAQGDKKAAHDAFVKCIEIPDTPFASRSRYFLAQEEIDKKAYDNAYTILKQNLHDDNPSFDRVAHEKSLYKMAWLVLHMKKFEEASVYLKECQQLYPENPSAYLAREQLGECFRQLARKEAIEEKANQVRASEVNDDRRMTFMENARGHKQARVRWLTMAVKVFQDLADDLGKTKAPSVQEQQLIRRAWFGIGECLLDNDELGESMRVFGEVQKKNRKTLEGFYACLRICHMADVLQMRPLPKEQIDFARDRAEDALRSMGEDLPTIAEDDEMFQHPDAPSRDEWQRWRLAMQQRLRPPVKNENPPPVFP